MTKQEISNAQTTIEGLSEHAKDLANALLALSYSFGELPPEKAAKDAAWVARAREALKSALADAEEGGATVSDSSDIKRLEYLAEQWSRALKGVRETVGLGYAHLAAHNAEMRARAELKHAIAAAEAEGLL